MASERERVAQELCDAESRNGGCACKLGEGCRCTPACHRRMLDLADRAIALGARAPDTVEELVKDVQKIFVQNLSPTRSFLIPDVAAQIVRHVLANTPGKES